MKKIAITIAGCKEFKNYNFFEEKCYEIISPYLEENYQIIIRERELYTVDAFAVRFALENNFLLERYKIDWSNKGKSAGIWNNKDICYGKIEENNFPSKILIVFTTPNMQDDKLLIHLLDEFDDCITYNNSLEESQIFVF